MITKGHVRFFIIGSIIVLIGWMVIAVLFAPIISGEESKEEAEAVETSITIETLPYMAEVESVEEETAEVVNEIEVIETEVVPVVEDQKTSVVYKLTAYCPCSLCCGKSDGITATGVKAQEGRTIAVDPRVIPYGTEVVINGHTYIAEDCGGGIKGNKIDIYFDTHTEALQFGVQYADVYVNV